MDLDGDGIEITALSKTPPVLFDADGDAIRTATAWAGADDGLLVLDRNGNGTIDSGAELFGDETVRGDGTKAPHGFAALAELDSSHDGFFTAADARFADVRVWRDLNQDGISQAGELKSLGDTGIASIQIASTATSRNYGDAFLVQDGTFTRSDGSSGEVGSFILAQNNFVQEFPPINVSGAAEALPSFSGGGWVRNLREAATESPDLISLEQRAESATTHAGYVSAVSNLLRAWGNDSAYNSASKQALAAGYGLILSEPLNDQERGWMDVAVKGGREDRDAFRATLADSDRTKFDSMRERMVGGLEKVEAYEAFTGFTFLKWQTILGDALNYTQRSVPHGRVPVEVTVPLSQLLYENRNAVMAAEDGYIRVTIPEPPVGMPHVDALWKRLVDDATENLMPTLRLAKYVDQVDLSITESGVTLDFSRLDASLASAMSADPYEGAFLFLDLWKHYGDSFDAEGWDGDARMRDLGIRAATENPVHAALSDAGYQLRGAAQTSGSDATDLFIGDGNANQFAAAGGDDFLDGQGGADVLQGGAGNDRIFGGDGDDVLKGDDGNDMLDGGAGNDYLEGGYGVDVLRGGAGDDVLRDSGSNTTFRFGLGDGHDLIDYVYDTTPGKINTLAFDTGIDASMVSVRRNGDNLIVKIDSTGDSVEIKNFAPGSDPHTAYNPIQQITFEDGTTWNVDTLVAKSIAGNAGSDTLIGTTAGETIDGGAGDDRIEGRSGNDTLLGGAGNDVLIASAGDDRLEGGAGDDYLEGGYGVDTLIGGAGDDTMRDSGGDTTYRFGLGDGHDLIDWVYNADPAKSNTLAFESGIEASMVTVRRSGSSLDVTIDSTGDSIKVLNFAASDDPSSPYNPLQRITFADGTTWDLAAIVARSVTGSSGDDHLTGTIGNDVLSGGLGNDTLYGGDGDDLLKGGDGNDYLEGGYGVDTLIGGAGDDTMRDSGGNTTYRFGLGDGHDLIDWVYNPDPAKLNTLSFESGIDASMVTVRRDGSNIDIRIDSTGDSIKVLNFAVNDDPTMPHNPLQRITFADGTTWSLDDIVTRSVAGTGGNDNLIGTIAGQAIEGGAGDDSIAGRGGNDVLRGGDGNDTIVAGGGDDRLEGGAGNDNLEGGYGVDVLSGGAGDDILRDSGGDTTFRFGLGDGHDFIDYVYDATPGKLNTLALGEGIDPSMVSVRRTADGGYFGSLGALEVKLNETGETVKVRGFFASDDGTSPYNPMQRVMFVDGTIWTVQDLVNMSAIGGGGSGGSGGTFGTAGDDVLTGSGDAVDTLRGLGGNDTLNAVGGYDTLYGGDGNDVLNAGGGYNTLDGGDGDDVLNSSYYDGETTYVGGKGNDTINGAYYADHYQFDRGDGHDVMSEAGPGYFNDTLAFGSGIVAADLMMTRAGLDLVIKIVDSDDQITVKNWFNNDWNQIETLSFTDGTTLSKTQINATVLEVFGTLGDDTMSGVTNFTDILHGGAGNDVLNAAGGYDVLYGDAGNDTLTAGGGYNTLDGGDGDDVLNSSYYDGETTYIGGKGNDTINGAYYNDHYKFDRGDGQDTINEGGPGYFNDTLTFGSAIAVSDVSVLRSGVDLLINVAGGDDRITVKNWFNSDWNQIETLSFADGTTWSKAQINTVALEVFGTAGDDTLTGVNAFADVLRGLGGNDTLNASGGVDTLDGGDGDDTLNADYYNGETTYIGGKGNDTINGAYYNDHYRFDRGDGQDIINEGGPGYFNDTLAFGAGIAVADVSAQRAGVDLLFKVAGGDDQIVVKNWFNSDWNQIETVSFADGTTWSKAQINTTALEVFGTNGNDTLNGVSAFADVLRGLGGNDTLTAVGGYDTLDGGDGDDILNADYYNGETTYLGGKGNDTINGAYYADHYQFGRGDGQDVINDSGPGYFADTMTFGTGVAAEQIWFKHVANDLEVSIIGTTDQFLVKDWYSSGSSHIELLKLSDGTTLLDSQVSQLVDAMASFDKPAPGQTDLPASYQSTLTPIIASAWHA